MSSQSGTKAIAAARRARRRRVAGCSDIYYDRRETIALGAGDADRDQQGRADDRSVAARTAPTTRSPSTASGCRRRTDRYNRGKVITPVLPTTSSKDYQTAQQHGCAAAVGDQPVDLGDAGGGGQGTGGP